MIVVHHLERSRSQRVLWLLEELGVAYRVQHWKRDPRTMLAPPELRAVHPLGKSPVIVDGDRVVAESGAILEYLAERHGGGRFVPAAGSEAALRCRYWMHYAEGSAMPPLLMSLVFSRLPKGPMPFFVRPLARSIAAGVRRAYLEPQLQQHLRHIDAELAQRPWFAGDEISLADVQMSFPIEAFAARGGLAAAPHAAAWLERVRARPAWRRAVEQGGGFELLR